MTYNDIVTSQYHTNAYCVDVELHGQITHHWVLSASYDDAVNKLTRTGWFINSARNIA